MGVTIPLPELDVPKPAPAPPPDALAEFQRAASLETSAAQQQAIQAQAQGQQQQNQMQEMQLKDEQLRRSLAPQFVQKDDNGKPSGFDSEGLYNAMLQQGADPLTIQSMRMKQAEMQKTMIGLSDAQIAHQEKLNDEIYNGIESVRTANREGLKNSPQQAAPAQTPSPLGPAVPGTGGMPAGMLPNMPQAQDLGKAAPGSPESLGAQPPGESPTATETGLQTAANAPKPITQEGQLAYHKVLLRLASMGVPVGNFPASLTSEADLDQAEAGAGLHKQQLADAAELAKTQEAAGKGAQAEAEAKKANLISFPELGALYHADTGEVTSINGQTMSPAMLESKYVMNQAQKNRTGVSPDPQFDKAYEHMKTLVPSFNINMAAQGAGMIPGGGSGGNGGAPASPSIEQVPNAIKGTVQQIVDYRAQMPPAGRNNPTNNAIRYWVNALDPQHDETTFPARNKMMTAMTSGPEATQINAINTALGHVGVLNDAIDALHNGDGGVKALRDIANKVGVQVGDTPVTTLNTIIHRVGPELTAAYVQGGGGEGERGTTAADFDPSLGNKQLKDNAAITTQLLRSKIGSIENQYKNTMQRGDFQQRFITPEAQRTLDKLSPQTEGEGDHRNSRMLVPAGNSDGTARSGSRFPENRCPIRKIFLRLQMGAALWRRIYRLRQMEAVSSRKGNRHPRQDSWTRKSLLIPMAMRLSQECRA